MSSPNDKTWHTRAAPGEMVNLTVGRGRIDTTQLKGETKHNCAQTIVDDS